MWALAYKEETPSGPTRDETVQYRQRIACRNLDPTIKPGALELGAYGDGRAAHQYGFRAQEVY